MTASTVQIRSKGVITVPAELRRQYGLAEGDILTVVDLGEGALLLVPLLSQVARLGEQVASAMKNVDVTLDDLLDTLDEERERYYREHYAQG